MHGRQLSGYVGKGYSETSEKGHSEKGQTSQQKTIPESLVYTLYRRSPLKEDNLSTRDDMAGPKGVPY